MNCNGGQPVSDKGAIRYLNQQVKEKNKVLSDLKHDFLLVGDHLGVDKATGKTQDYLDAIAGLKEVALDSVNVKLLTENKEVKEMNERLDKKVGELKEENRKNVPWELHDGLVKKLREEIAELKGVQVS
jgi:hypothetical protein